MVIFVCLFLVSFFTPSFRYLLISVNPKHLPLNDFMHLQGNYFLIKWKIVWVLLDLHYKQLYSETFPTKSESSFFSLL